MKVYIHVNEEEKIGFHYCSDEDICNGCVCGCIERYLKDFETDDTVIIHLTKARTKDEEKDKL